MNVNEAYPSKYLSASDLHGRKHLVTITHLDRDEVGANKDIRPIMYTQQFPKGIVLNKTNAITISGFHGDEMDNWVGKQIVLKTEIVTKPDGSMGPAIRMEGPENAPAQHIDPQAPQGYAGQPVNQQPPQQGYQGQNIESGDPGPTGQDMPQGTNPSSNTGGF